MRRGPAELVKSCVDLRADSVQRLGQILVGFLLSHETRQSLCVDLATWNPPTTGVLLSRVEDPVGDRNGSLHGSLSITLPTCAGPGSLPFSDLDRNDHLDRIARFKLETVQPGSCLATEDRSSGRPIQGCSQSPECCWISGWRNTRLIT